MFDWIIELFRKESLVSSVWVKKLMQGNHTGSYSKYQVYYDKHVVRVHKIYYKDFVRFERYALQHYKKNDQQVFIAIKTAMCAQHLGQIKVAACITAAVIYFNKIQVKKDRTQVHPKLLRATVVLHKQLIEIHSKQKKRNMQAA